MADLPLQHSTTRLGMVLCLIALLIFATQDSITKLLVRDYHPAQFIMIRYWVFAMVIIVYAAYRGKLQSSLKSARPGLQFIRSTLLIIEMVLFTIGLKFLGLAEMHALFATFPLMATALAGLFLAEHIGWYRRIAVVIGFAGAVLIIKPGLDVFQPIAIIGLTCALMFAAYSIITRFVGGRDDALTSLVYMAVIGSILVTPFGLYHWRMPDGQGWALIGILSVTGLVGHALLVKALEFAPASTLQPLNYFLVAWATIFGVSFFGERPDILSILGTLIIVGSGLFAMFRERVRKQEIAPIDPGSLRR